MVMRSRVAAFNSEPLPTYVDDVFSTWLYTGNGSTQTITNGIDLAGKGGLVWIKCRGAAFNNCLVDTVRGANQTLFSNDTVVNQDYSGSGTINNFSSTGFGVGTNAITAATLAAGGTFAAWTFCKAAKFFDVRTVTHTNGTANNIDLSVLGTVGIVIAKNTTTIGDWTVWQRSLTASNNLKLNTIAAQSTTGAWLSVSGTSATLAAAAPTGTYVIYAYAHNTSSTGLIQSGSFTTDASGNATVNLGWEPQYMLTKCVSTTGSWFITDTARNWSNSDAAFLYADLANAESALGGSYVLPTATGFQWKAGALSNSQTFIYMAIRRPNKPPTLGTQVYNAIARAGTGAAATVSGVGFAPDFSIIMERNRGAINVFLDRLRGATKFINSINTAAELTIPDNIFFNQNGITVGADTGGYGNNQASITYINHFFKRAPGFFDVVCYTGTGSGSPVLNHSLNAVPELMIFKPRTTTTDNNWSVYCTASSAVGKTFNLNTTGNYNGPLVNTLTTTSITLNDNTTNNTVSYVAYFFATLAGISKVGSYTGNGSSQTINCGFAAGARFVLIKRTDAAGDWYVWDSVRGITTSAGNDPHLSLNATAVEVTDDSIDSTAVGFIVKQIVATNINVSSATYMYLAIA